MTFRLILLCLLLPVFAEAHDARPISLEINQEGDGFLYSSRLRVPDAIDRAPQLLMPGNCEAIDELTVARVPGSETARRTYSCGSTIQGHEIGLGFASSNPSLSTVVRVLLSDGVVYSTILPPSETRWVVPEEEQALKVAGQYIWLGVEHIWLGIDHLLFVLCLVFVAAHVPEKRWQRILVTITGFTIAHSITLVASTLDLVYLPIPAVEAVIALSIVFLSLEILRDEPDSWTYRYPVSVAASFGLLHGFGFASVLRDIGLPQTELPVALLSFNVGVEIGQILFVLVVLAVGRLVSDLNEEREAQVRVFASYLVGTLATFWLIDRTLSFWV